MPLDPAWLQASFPSLSRFKHIGGGGQKWVFEAEHPEYGRIVLKLFHPMADPERALREAQTGERLSSPLVPSVRDSGMVDSPVGEMVWIVEELVPGSSLRVRMGHEMEPHVILSWARALLGILAEAEASNIVHRDVKPENILIDDEEMSWLVDFGLARHLDLSSITATEAARGVGTPGYSPPEQFMNLKDDIDSRADLFGLGVTLYECCEGTNPFVEGAASANEVFQRILDDQLPPISESVVRSGSFRDLILAMTRREREHRPRSVAESLEWIGEICREAGV